MDRLVWLRPAKLMPGLHFNPHTPKTNLGLP